jgi:hypothetical protein
MKITLGKEAREWMKEGIGRNVTLGVWSIKLKVALNWVYLLDVELIERFPRD